MESIAVDAGTATRMVKFLNSELQAAQREIEELKERCGTARTTSSDDSDPGLREENDRLKQEVADFRVRLEAALEEQDTKMILPNTPPDERYDALCSRLLAVEKEKYEAEQSHKGIVQALEEKLAATREKYKKAKHWKTQHSQSLDDIQTRLDEALAQNVSNLTGSPFDPVAFLKAKDEEVPVGVPPPESAFEFSFRARLPKTVELANCERAILSVHDEQTIFPEPGRYGRFLVLVPEWVLHPPSGNPTWRAHEIVYEMSTGGDREREIVLKREHWHHCGTYECVGSIKYTVDDARKLWSARVEKSIRQTTRQSQLLPPIVTSMIPNMYKSGLLSFVCFGFKYTGCSERYRKTVQKQGKGGIHNGLTGPTPPVVKRKADAEQEAYLRKKAKATHLRW